MAEDGEDAPPVLSGSLRARSIRVEDELWQDVVDEARHRGLSISEYVRRTLHGDIVGVGYDRRIRMVEERVDEIHKSVAELRRTVTLLVRGRAR